MPEFEDIATTDGAFQNVRKNVVRDKLNKAIIKVGGTNYTIGIKNRVLERFKVAGQTDFFNSTILLEANLTEGNMLITMLHEMIECFSRQYYMDIPHELISEMEAHLFDVLIDNPLVLKLLLEYAYKNQKERAIKNK
jgi:hypothetical protein